MEMSVDVSVFNEMMDSSEDDVIVEASCDIDTTTCTFWCVAWRVVVVATVATSAVSTFPTGCMASICDAIRGTNSLVTIVSPIKLYIIMVVTADIAV